MSRRLNRPNKTISKSASNVLSDVRRAQINDIHSKSMDEDSKNVFASIAHSSKFKTNINKTGSIVSPMTSPTTTSHTERMSRKYTVLCFSFQT